MASFNLGGAFGGAGTGATLGASFGGPLGGVLGGLGGALFGGFGSSKRKPKNVSTLDPKQRSLLDAYIQAIQGGGGPLADIFSTDPQSVFENFNRNYAKPAYQNFQENIIPSITGQFRGNNLQNSSYLGQALSQAGTRVQNNLDDQLANILFQSQQEGNNRRFQGLNNVTNMQTFNQVAPQNSIFDSLLGSLASGAGDILAGYLSNRGANA